jgi:hypothetical protein
MMFFNVPHKVAFPLPPLPGIVCALFLGFPCFLNQPMTLEWAIPRLLVLLFKIFFPPETLQLLKMAIKTECTQGNL